VNRDLPVPATALAIGAHPDDIEFGCGATLAKWADAGCVVHHLVCTDGSKGTWDPHADLTELVALRQVEQRLAAKALGATGEVVFLGWPDGELAWVADFPGVTLVPDRRRDGTNVAAVPTAVTFSFAYGKGSFARHRAAAARLDLPVRIVEDAALGWDVDLPADLAWPRAAADPTAAARR